MRALWLSVLVVGATLAVAPVGTATAASTSGNDGIVYVDTSGNLQSVTQSGSVVDYGVDDPAAIGPAADIDGDSLREVPFVTSNGKVKIVDDEGEVQQLGDYSAVTPRQSGTKLAIGDWDEDGNYDVFFASQESGQNIYRVDWDERNDQPQNLGLFDSDAAQFMLGSTDITGDGIRDLVFVSSSSSLYYVNGTGKDVLLTSSTKWGSNNNIGLGEPADFDDSGGSSPTPADFEYPRVDGSNNAGYLSNDQSLTKTAYSGTSAKKAPPTAADITGDGVADHVYIGSNNGYLRYKQDPTQGGATGSVTDSNGNELSADASIGLVGRISSFTERASLTDSGKNAGGDSTAPGIDGGTLAADNSYVDVDASEGVYANADGTGGVAATALTATLSGDSDGSVSGVTVDTVTQTDGTDTTGGETTVRASLSISGTPSGDESVEVQPADGNSVYDAAGNAMAETESTGSLSLSDQQPPSFSAGPSTSSVGANGFDIEFTADEDGTGYYVVLSDGATAPSATQVQNGVDGDGNAATDSGSGSITAGSQATFAASGLSEDTPYDVYVVAADASGNANLAPKLDQATDDTTAPTVTGGTVASDNSYVDLSVSEGVYANGDGTGGVTASDVEAVLSGDSDGSVSGVSVDGVTRTDGSATAGGETTLRLSLSVSGTPSGDETVAVGPASGTAVYDGAGNAMADGESASVTLADQQAPSDPTSTSPTDDADGVAADTGIDLTFGEDVRVGTGTVTLSRSSDDSTVESIDVTTSQVTASGKTVTVDPSVTLSSETDYYLTVDSGAIEDRAGNAYAGFTDSTTLNFTTEDTVGPTVAGSSVALDATGGDELTLSFDTDEALGDDSGDLSVAVDGPTTTDVYQFDRSAFSESPSGTGYTYTLSTAQPFDDGDGKYTATVETARDAAGNDGATGESATHDFDGTAPTVSSLSATNPDGQSVTITVETDEALSTVETAISGPESATLSTSAFTESVDGGTYTYTATYEGSSAGEYTTELTSAVDAAGNDGAGGQTDAVTIAASGGDIEDTEPTTIDGFGVSATEGELRVTVESSAPLTAVDVAVDGPSETTLSTAAFTGTTGGETTATSYTASYDPAQDGEYTVELTSAVGRNGTDAASGQSATVVVGETGISPDGVTLRRTGDGLSVAVRSQADLDALTVEIDGPETAARSLSAFDAERTDAGGYVYRTTVPTATDGSYTATVTEASVDGDTVESGQSDTVGQRVTVDPGTSSYVATDGTAVTYRVERSAIPNGTDPSTVEFSRWTGTNAAVSASGELVEKTDTHYVYRVRTPGLAKVTVTTQQAAQSDEAELTAHSGTPLFPVSGLLVAGLLVLPFAWRWHTDESADDPLGEWE